MKRLVSILCVIGLLGLGMKCYAQFTSNASPAVVSISESSRLGSVNFPAPTRNLYVRNNDSAGGIWVDFNTSSNTSCKNYTTTDAGQCYYLDAETSIELFDFITEGITFEMDQVFTGDLTASPPISVLATY